MSSVEWAMQAPPSSHLAARLSSQEERRFPLFWGVLPLFLSLATLGVSALLPISYAGYLPWTLFLAFLLPLLGGKKGVWGSYTLLALCAFLYREGAPSGLFWHLGLFSSLALTLFISQQACEACYATLEGWGELGRAERSALRTCEQTLQKVQEEKKEVETALEAEIQKLKEEAKQRLIERRQEEKRIALVESEIELLTSQKREVLAEVYHARALLARLSTQEAEEKARQHALSLAEERIRTLEAECAALQEKVALAPPSLSEESAALPNEGASQGEEAPVLVREASLSSEPAQEADAAPKTDASLEGEADRELRNVQGMYKQLRMQFEEKREVLSQTRQALFQTEGKLLALEHELALASGEPGEQERSWEREFCNAAQEVGPLEEEVSLLESLLSSLLSKEQRKEWN